MELTDNPIEINHNGNMYVVPEPLRQGFDEIDKADQLIELQASVDSLTAANNGLVDLVSNLESMVTELLDTQRKTMELVGAVKDEIVPALDQISAGPVGKMLGLKKKESE